MKSILTHTILEQCDCNAIVFLDTSEYQGDVTSPILRIFPPDLNSYVNINYNLNAITVIKPEHIKFSSFPSGVYRFIQSICPNADTEVETCYLNVCNERDAIKKIACDDQKLEELADLLFYLDIAQGIVNECKDKAIEILQIVQDKISKLKGC